MMSSLKSVAKKAGVTPQAVRGWLDREDLAAKCWDFQHQRYQIPDEVESRIIQYYQGKRDNEGVKKNRGNLTIKQMGEQIEYLRTQNEYLLRVNHELMLSIIETDKLLKDVYQALPSPEIKQQEEAVQQSPHVHVVQESKSNRVRDFVRRLTGR